MVFANLMIPPAMISYINRPRQHVFAAFRTTYSIIERSYPDADLSLIVTRRCGCRQLVWGCFRPGAELRAAW
jgi:hypothetical protein